MTLERLLEDKRALLIMDNATNIDDVRHIVDAAGPKTGLLITTQDQTLGHLLGAQGQELGLLSDEEAASFLANWIGPSFEIASQTAARMLQLCGNLPLALAIIGAILRETPHRAEHVLQRLENAQLDRLTRRLPNYGYPNLVRALSVSEEHLSAPARNLFSKLAVLVPGRPIPEQAIIHAISEDGEDALDVQELLDEVISRSLLLRVGPGQYQLHDLVRSFLIGQTEDAAALHRFVIGRYSNLCVGQWETGPDDGYFFQHLPHHLSSAEMSETLSALLFNFDWMSAKLAAIEKTDKQLGGGALSGDLALGLQTNGVDASAKAGLRQLKLAIDQTLQFISAPGMLAQQLLARLDDRDDAFKPLLETAKSRFEPGQLRPRIASLVQDEGIIGRFRTPSGNITSGVFSEKRNIILSGGFSSCNRVDALDVGTGRITQSYTDDEANNTDSYDWEEGSVEVGLSADERIMMVSGSECGMLTLWDIDEAVIIGRLQVNHRVKMIIGFADHFALTVYDDAIQIWNLDTQNLELELEVLLDPDSSVSIENRYKMHITSAAIESSQRFLALGDRSGHVGLFDLAEHQFVCRKKVYDGEIGAVQFDQNAPRLFIGVKGKIGFFSTPDLIEQTWLRAEPDRVNRMAISACGAWLASAGTEGSITVWNLSKTERLRTINVREPVYFLHIDDNQRVFSGDLFGNLKIWRGQAGTGSTSTRTQGHSQPISDLVMTSNGGLLVSTARKEPNLLLWNPVTGEQTGCIEVSEGASGSLVLLPGEQVVVSAGNGQSIVGFDLSSGNQVWQLDAPVGDVSCLIAMVYDGSPLLISGHWGGAVLIWSMSEMTLTGALPRQEADAHWRSHAGYVRSLAFRAEYNQLIVGTEDNVEVWCLKSGQRLNTYFGGFGFDQSENFVNAIRCLPNDRIISSCTDGALKIHRVDRQGEVANELTEDESVRWSDGTGLIGATDGSIFGLSTRKNSFLLFDGETTDLLSVFVGDSAMLACASSANALDIAVGDNEGVIHFLRRQV